QNELAGKGVKICDELITLEVRSADVCDLTLIDLPGIARVPVQGQPQDIGNQWLFVFFQIVVQRMADQLPMLISFYMLKETAELLCTDMLSILEGANVSELLFENSDLSKRRKYLQTLLARLTAAHEELNDFI
ncbi:hypothetical protein cypCar_00045805, partial [Cyprinus carpio]